MMRAQRLMIVGLTCVVAGSLAFAQVGRGGSQWLTPLADAQRTSWVRSDEKISVEALSKGGFELQWTTKLENQPRGAYGLGSGVTASGVTLFIPVSLVTGSSNNVYAIDNDLGYVTWERKFNLSLPAPTPGCPGASAPAPRASCGSTERSRAFRGSAAGVERLVIAACSANPVKACRSKDGQAAPVAAVAVRQRRHHRLRHQPPRRAAASRTIGSPDRRARRQARTGARDPTALRVGYVITSDGMLHVLGLPSGKDIQRPARFLPANARWSSPIGVDTMLYAATSGGCGGAPTACGRSIWTAN
jgi:hypothetical protein